MTRKLRPVFVFAVPRSGTTMLGAMLGASAEAVALPESPFIGILHYRHLLAGGKASADSIVQELNAHYRLAHWGIGRVDDRFQTPERLDDAAYAALIDAMVHAFAEKEDKADIGFWIEHSPVHSRYVESLARAFPNAFFLHLVRDGRAVAASVLPLDWGANTVKEAAHTWLEDLGYGFTAEQALGNDRCLRVRYEDLILSPDEALRQICAFVGLTYDPAMITGRGLRIPRYTQAQHKLVGQGPDKTRIDAWREQLTTREVKIFEDIAGPMLLRLGYPLSQDRTPQPTVFRERVIMGMRGFLRKELRNRIANRLRRGL